MYNIQKNYGYFDKIPICNTIKKILIGKLIKFNYHSRYPMVILGVRRNNLYGYLEILTGEYNGYSISVYSWYAYCKNAIFFVGRDSKKNIRKCLKTNPKYIHYHLGKSIDLSNVAIYKDDGIYNYYGKLIVYDNRSNYYGEYCNKV